MTRVSCPVCHTTVDVPAPYVLYPCTCGTILHVERRYTGTSDGAAPSGTRLDYYAVLGVAPDADTAEIKAAYRRRSKETHPDTGGDADTFRVVNRAYRVLSDPRRRAAYDAGERQHHHHARVTMPDLTGVTIDEALAALDALGLTVVLRIDPVDNDSPLRDRVIAQYPYVGAPVDPDTACSITVAVSVWSLLWRGLKQAATRFAARTVELGSMATAGFLGAAGVRAAVPDPRSLSPGERRALAAGETAAHVARRTVGLASTLVHVWLYLVTGTIVGAVLTVAPPVGVVLAGAWFLMYLRVRRSRLERRRRGLWY